MSYRKCLTILLIVFVSFSFLQAQVDLKKRNSQLGLNPNVTMPNTEGLSKASAYPNIRVYPSTGNQTETSISVNPINSNQFSGGANTDAGQGYYHSTDGGNTWSGSDHLLQTSIYASDPAITFDRNSYAYFSYLDNGQVLVSKSIDGGINWQNPVAVPTSTTNPDKEYITADVNSTSNYTNHLYIVWTDFPASNPIRFSRSTDGGSSFAGNLNISGAATTSVQAGVPAVGPNGEVYVVWSIGTPQATGIGFNESLDGGASFLFSAPPTITSVTEIGTFSNSRYRLKITSNYPDGIRVNSFPSIAVDRSGGVYNGSIYVVWADARNGDPDIYLIKGIPGLSGNISWSTPARVNDDPVGNGKDQWLPWVSVGPDGAVNIVYYDSRNDVNNLLTEVYVARSINGGQSFQNYEVSSTPFTPIAIPGYASGYMGDYIGIVSTQGKAFPFWMDNRNGTYQVYTAMVSGTTPLTLKQNYADGTTVSSSSIGRWNGYNFTTYTPNSVIDVSLGNTEVLRGDQSIYTGQKYNKWIKGTSDEQDVANHHLFPITTGFPGSVTSQFSPTYSGITIQNSLEGGAAGGGTIDFKDPWLIDYADPDYGNNLRNQGMIAPFKKVASPFNPSLTSGYSGVFLNQSGPPQWNPPYYSVSVQSPQTIYLSADNKNHDFYFQNWNYDTSKISLQSPASYTTGVVFKTSDALLTANLKGTQLSDNTSAIAGNGQRKIVRTGDGTMHLVYESMGHVWYETSYDNGASWQLVNAPSPIDTGGGKSPAIDFLNFKYNQQNYNTYFVVILFQQKYGSNYKLKALVYRKTDLQELFQPFQAVDVFTSSESYDTYNAKPVIAIDSALGGVTMLWQYNAGGGLYYSRANISSTGMNGVTAAAKVPGTTVYSQNPSVAASKIAYASATHHICWDENNTIYYVTYNNNLNSFGTLQNLSGGLGYAENSNPSIIAINDGSARVVWQGRYRSYTSYNTVFHDPGYYWGYWTFNAGGWALNPNLVITDRQTGYAFAWNEGDNGYFAFQNLSAITPIAKNGGFMMGQYFQICNGPTKYDLYADALNHTAQPHYFDLSSSFGSLGMLKVSSKTNASVIGRSIILSKDNARFFFDIGNLNVDGRYVSFPNIPGDDNNTVEQDMSEYLTSEPFDITENSKIKYTVKYGINNGKSTVSPLEKDENTAFRLELVDANTNEELGSFNEVRYDRTSNEGFNIRHYKINAEGLGVRPGGKSGTCRIKLKISVDKNFDANYALAATVTSAADSTLQKKTDYQEISLKKTAPITTYDLAQNYPNPFNPSTVIKYQLPKDGFVTLKVYDILGREVKTLVNEYQTKGRYNVTFNAENLASGMYIYQLRSNDFVANKKLMLMK